MRQRKKLTEVALPLEAINKASAREKSIRHGHPSTLHLWWARRPLAAARAVIFAQMVEDPSEYPKGKRAAAARLRKNLEAWDLKRRAHEEGGRGPRRGAHAGGGGRGGGARAAVSADRGARAVGEHHERGGPGLVCRPRPDNAPTATRREFVSALKNELPDALKHLQEGNIAPVDLQQAAIGPGMAVFTRYGKVIDAEGKPVTVREALKLINQTLDEVLAEQEGDFDADTRFAVSWFDQFGFGEGVRRGRDALEGQEHQRLRLGGSWPPGLEGRKGAAPAARRVACGLGPRHGHAAHRLGDGAPPGARPRPGGASRRRAPGEARQQAEVARELAYRLYSLCERRKRAAEALAYNGLVQSWPEILNLSREERGRVPSQGELSFDEK